MSNLKNFEKLKKEFGGSPIKSCFEERKSRQIWFDFMDALFKYNAKDRSWEADWEGEEDITDEEIDEDAAFQALWDLKLLGEYASKLME